MTTYHLIPFIFWSLLSLFVLIFCQRLDLGNFQRPGPGLVPFLLGLVLLVASLYPIIRFFLKKREAAQAANEVWSPAKYRKMVFVLVCLLGYSFFFERLGFVLSTSIFLVFLFRGMGNRWISVVIGSAITILVTYFLFTSLGVRFPKDFW